MSARGFIYLLLLCALASVESFAQRNPSRGRSFFGGGGYATDPIDYARGRGRVPPWALDSDLPRDCFTFARVKYRSWTQRRSFTWYTDYRDSDLNLSFRLHQLTAMRVEPEGTYFEITDPRLFDFPFVFMSGVGGWELDENEATILRNYMLGGGFIMFDDFHGHAQWDNFYKCIKMIFPDREPMEIPLEHEIFHTVFDLKEKYQVPNIGIGTSGGGRTWESPDWKEVHYCAIYDNKGRMVCFIGHNTDLGDGWEEESEDPFYFQTFSEPMAFPIGINVLVYAMMH
jgi:hypothetical protein